MHDLKRIPLWRGPYADFIDEMRLTPFDWKGHECVCWLAGRAVEVLTGVDLYSDFVDRFDDKESALKLIKELGFDDVADLIASRLPEYEHPSQAQIGDIVSVPMKSDFKHAVGVMNGEFIFVMGPMGLSTLDRRHADRAFKVG